VAEGRRVLVVDDDLDTRRLLGELLALEGYAVSLAEDGQRALQSLGAGALPDLILLDWHMPVLDGGGLLASLASDPRLASIPVLALSASRLDLGHDGIREVLRKPFDIARLLSSVSRWSQAGR
jgi:two-component system, chemotaxis family, chemotaxis protein CheY